MNSKNTLIKLQLFFFLNIFAFKFYVAIIAYMKSRMWDIP